MLRTRFLFAVLLAGLLIITSANQGEALVTPTQATIRTDGAELKILSRHETEILADFREAFLASSFAADIGWGPSDTDKVQYLQVSSTTGWINALQSETQSVDLAWGGGPTLFNQMIEADLLIPFPAAMVDYLTNDVNIPDEVAQAPTRQEDDGGNWMWVANAISSFGFTVNHDKLEEWGLEKPTTWQDLASPDFFLDENIATIAMGNPTQTTSNTRIYHIILQKFMEDVGGVPNWDKGWEIMNRMAGNGAIFGESLPTRAAVINEQVAVAMTIDFYGVFAQRENARTEYVIPEGGSVVNGDPIAFGMLMDSQPEAEAFMKFVSSSEGQAVWVKNDRLPINPDAFSDPSVSDRTDVKDLYDTTLVNSGIDFDEDLAQDMEFFMQHYFESTITDAHGELKAAWTEVAVPFLDGETTIADVDASAAELFKPFHTLQEAVAMNDQLKTDTAFKNENKDKWTADAIDRFEGAAGDSSGIPFNFSWVLGALITSVVILRKAKNLNK